METLALRFHRSSAIFWPQAEEDNIPAVNLREAFPTLKRLHLDVATDWDRIRSETLPSSIVSLQIALPIDLTTATDVLRSLPPTIRHLTAICHPGAYFELGSPLFELLPRQLESLILDMNGASDNSLGHSDSMSAEILATLPRSLHSVCIRTRASQARGTRLLEDVVPDNMLIVSRCTPETAKAIPPSISSLHVVPSLKPLLPLYQQLSPQLTRLIVSADIPCDSKLAQALPRHLTAFTCNFKSLKEFKEGDFPSTLRELHVRPTSGTITSSKIGCLPALTAFHCLTPLASKTISNLPRTITDLSVAFADIEASPMNFPPNLQKLFAMDYNVASFGVFDPKKRKTKVLKQTAYFADGSVLPLANTATVVHTLQLTSLPRGLQQLSIHGIPIAMSALVHLPRRLTLLHIDLLCHDQLYDPNTEAALDKAKEVCEDFEVNSSLWNENPQVTMVDWLPRTLTHLYLCGQFNLPIAAWSRAPRSLNFLELSSFHTIDQDILNHLPMSRMTDLTLNWDVLDDDHFKQLPKSLKKLSFTRPCLHLTSRLAGHPLLDLVEIRYLDPELLRLHLEKAQAFQEAAVLDKFEDLASSLQKET